jgi:hypothetical protein
MGTAVRAVMSKPLAGEIALLTLVGLFMASVGAFNTGAPSMASRLAYWLTVMVLGGLVGVALEAPLRRRIRGAWMRAAALTLLMSVPVTAIVWLTGHLVWDAPLVWRRFVGLWPAVVLVSATLNAIRFGGRRPPPGAAPADAPDLEPFRRRLSARTRHAALHAVEAHDHYLRVHTAAGTELVLMRFADALALLDGAGLQVHRSWWVAADAIEGVSWRRGRGVLRLKGGGTAPVSRSFARALRERGWF